MKNKEKEEEKKSTMLTEFLEAVDWVTDGYKSGYITEQEMLELIDNICKHVCDKYRKI